ncbi:LuxR C-terminal-related transcriptional regulator [Cohnella sp. AR92]|uniref:LuxR C-terminal-related transcriptional regulator n=1 Tax=Cohnella sp. AR92 TaxID=648716 RepID=UPI000F8E8F09|nr:LuxR C-terminal-related transcriptional regulator [Cohnella sp. AR92]RUS46773.1 hypothetical protein ELR57_13850 [Cohnella sp. AR92]
MERTKVRILQNLQDTYSAAYRLSILAVDGQGAPLTKPSLSESGEALARLMSHAEEYDLRDALRRLAPYVKDIQAVTRYDYETFLNMKYIVAPLKLPGGSNGTIWAGPWLDDSQRGSGLLRKSEFYSLPEGIEKTLEAIPSAQSSFSAGMMEKIGELAEAAAAILQPNEEREHCSSEELEHLQAVGRWTSPSFAAAGVNEEEVLRLALQTAGLGLSGFARKKEHERFEIESVVGDELGAALIGQSFHSGEGCLGHAALMQRRTAWEHTSGISNGGLFSKAGSEPQWIVGYPIIVREEVRGVLFGAEWSARRPSPAALEMLQLIANQWGDRLHRAEQQETQKKQALLVAMLNEVHYSIAEIPDLRRILTVMVETMHKLTGGAFSSIVLFNEPGKTAEAQIVSRGLRSDQTAWYAAETSERYHRMNAWLGQRGRTPIFRQTSWGEPVMEIPFCYGRKITGVLSIGKSERDAQESDRFFLSALAMIGELRLFELQQMEARANRSYLEILSYSLSYWDPEGYSPFLRKRELLSALCGKLGFSPAASDLIDQAYKISRYDPAFLWETIPWHSDAIGLLEEALGILEYRGQADAYLEFGFSQEAQALALVLDPLQDAGQEAADPSVQSVALGIRLVFEELLEEQVPSVSHVAIGRDPDACKGDELDYASLTMREREVLELLIQGCTNQDIAEKMYISSHTVKNHLTKIYMKLGVADRTSAMIKLLKA